MLLDAVGQRCGGGLVHESLHLQASQFAGTACGLALAIVEVGGNRDDGAGDFGAQCCLCICLQLLQHQCREFFRQEFTLAEPRDVLAAHIAFERRGGEFRMRGLPFAGGEAY